MSWPTTELGAPLPLSLHPGPIQRLLLLMMEREGEELQGLVSSRLSQPTDLRHPRSPERELFNQPAVTGTDEDS